jgi:AcrR family transcriptional regulator
VSAAAARKRAARGEGDQLREEILTAAEKLLIETASEDAVSIRAVADAVGVTAPSIYRHFPDKSHLLFEVCSRSFTGLDRAITDTAVSDDPFETLDAIARAYVRFGLEHPEHYRIMFMSRVDATPADFAEQLLMSTSGFGRVYETCERALATGRVRPTVAAGGATAMALLLWAQVHGLTSLLISKPAAPWPDLDDMLRLLLDVTHGGITGTDPPE